MIIKGTIFDYMVDDRVFFVREGEAYALDEEDDLEDE